MIQRIIQYTPNYKRQMFEGKFNWVWTHQVKCHMLEDAGIRGKRLHILENTIPLRFRELRSGEQKKVLKSEGIPVW